ncbi:MAG: C4-dicarboxylic acid transporter DauA [Nevskiales bacterium]|nr:C4-dicarboxylic acid transporter DauA [Nevskiales bacterium]
MISTDRIKRAFPPLASALRETLREGYRRSDLRHDILAGLAVGIIAVPLSLALAIASGVPPQHGLYTAFVAGALIALTGGSRFNVSGPTAAFVVILFPIAQQHGLGGLLVATFMAGLMLVAMGWGRMGQLIQYIPYPVTTGFTAGIAVVIASLQLKDLLGLDMVSGSDHFIVRMREVLSAVGSVSVPEISLGLATLALLIVWPRLRLPLPAYLGAAFFAGVGAWLLKTHWPDLHLITIADRFQYTLNGETRAGIPPLLPELHWPWRLPGKDGAPLELSFGLIRSLLGPAFAIAILGAIESLLCAVVADGMTGKKHDPDAELVAQGLGNLAAPLFGGIPATGALARTAASVRAGARSPLASLTHALFVLAAILTLASLLSWLPMCGLAALLLMVAWNMSERKSVLRILRVAPRGDVTLLLSCFALTVLTDMVLAIGVGVVLGSFFFMHRMSKVSRVNLVGEGHPAVPPGLPGDARFYEIAGPLFFGAAERAMTVLRNHDRSMRAVLLDLSAVPTVDISGLIALEEVIDDLNEAGIFVALCGAQRPVLRVLREAGYLKEHGQRGYYPSSEAAVKHLTEILRENGTPTTRSEDKDQQPGLGKN